MTELSPAAKAVLDAADIQDLRDAWPIAAALRVATDQVAPIQRSTGGGYRQHRSATAERLAIRREILAIVTELENIYD
jgi:hypothetical protein